MNELDRTLHDAFQSRHVPHDITPSLVDVRWRARRRHARRNAALVGCAAITGAGAVAVLATRHPGEQAGVGAGSADEPTASTVACYSFPTTTTMPTTGPGTYQVPCDPTSGGQGEWHCTDQVGIDEFGRDVFLSCEQQFNGFVATTTPAAVLPTVSTIEVFDVTTTNTIPITALPPMGTTTTSLG